MTPLFLMIVRILSDQGFQVDVCADRTIVIGSRCAVSLVNPRPTTPPGVSSFAPPPPPPRYDFEADEIAISNGF